MGKDPAVLFYTGDFLTGVFDLTMEERGQYITLLCMQHQKGHLSPKSMKHLVGEISVDVLDKFKIDDDGLYFNSRMEEEAVKRSKYCESRRQSRAKADEDQVRIYLIKDNDNGYIKIGSSVNPKRRFAEMCNQKNPAITIGETRNYTLIFESGVVERTVEKTLHDKFADKRILGEWFELTTQDILYIRKTYVNSYEDTAGERTENENENVNISNKVSSKDINTFYETIWKLYPRKEGKAQVSESQKRKLYSIGIEELARAIERYKAAKIGTEVKYLQHGSTFFNSGYVDYLDSNYQTDKPESPYREI